MGPKKHPRQTPEDQVLDDAARRGVSAETLRRREAQARYQASEKGRAVLMRYQHSEKRKAAQARYRHSEKGKLKQARNNDTRIYVGQHYRGKAQTVELANTIQNHIKERMRAFITRQSSRAEAEGAS